MFLLLKLSYCAWNKKQHLQNLKIKNTLNVLYFNSFFISIIYIS